MHIFYCFFCSRSNQAHIAHEPRLLAHAQSHNHQQIFASSWILILFSQNFKVVNLSIVWPLLWFVRWAKGSGWSDEKLHRGELKLQRVQFGLGEEPQHCNGDTLTDALSNQIMNQSRWAARTLFFYQCIKIWRLEEKLLLRPLKSF